MSLVKFTNQEPNLFDQFLNNDLFWSNQDHSATNTTLPKVNIKESNEGFQVEMSAPGLHKKDFKINLHNNILSISSEKKVENEPKEGQKFTRQEFSYQSFIRSFTLPNNTVREDDIEAVYENGILKVWIPKKEEAKLKPIKEIEIK